MKMVVMTWEFYIKHAYIDKNITKRMLILLSKDSMKILKTCYCQFCNWMSYRGWLTSTQTEENHHGWKMAWEND